MSTKDRILEEALSLFAQRGYDGTGVDLIAKHVGIKGPSLYKHFTGKEDIMNSLIKEAELRYAEYFGSEMDIGKIPETKDEFVQMALKKVSFSMNDPVIRKIRMFLVQEQFRNEYLAKITTKHQLDEVQQIYSKIINGMMNNGLIERDDPDLLAAQLISPIMLLVAKVDRQPECAGEAMKKIEGYIQHFCKVYVKG